MANEKAPAGVGTPTGGKGDSVRVGDLQLVNHTSFDIVPQESLFCTAEEIAAELKQSKSTGYRVIREINAMLKKKGLMTFHGRVLRRAFLEFIGAAAVGR